MSELSQVKQEIEQVRISLQRMMACKKGDTADPEVTILSRKLDKLIVQYQQLKEHSKM